MTNYETFNNSSNSFRIFCDKLTSVDVSKNLIIEAPTKNIEIKVIDGKKIIFKNDLVFNMGSAIDLNNKPLTGLQTISAESLNLNNIVRISNTNIINKSAFNSSKFVSFNNNIQDLSRSLYNTITIFNNSSIYVDINITLYCSVGLYERITVQLWRDLSMLSQSIDLGSVNSGGGIPIPYCITYLDENLPAGEKKYYLKYKLEENTSQESQGIINVKTYELQGSSSIILREIVTSNLSYYYNKRLFDVSNITTTSYDVQDLSALFYNTINVNDTNVQININANLYCSYSLNERINIEVWRDLSMISQSSNLGTTNATAGLTIPYSFSYLDTNLSNGLKKYYLKYKLEKDPSTNATNTIENQGIVNISTLGSIGSSNILLENVAKNNNNNILINNNNNNNNNNRFLTSTSILQDLSGLLYNIINIDNNSSVLVDLNITLFCCYAAQERITIELWRDLSMISKNANIGNVNATKGLTINYRLSLLDEDVGAGEKKYYLKYQLESNLSAQEQGILNITGGYSIIDKLNLGISYNVLSYTKIENGTIKNTKIGYNPNIMGDKGRAIGRSDAFFKYIDVNGANSHINESLYVKKNIVIGTSASITSDLSVNAISLNNMYDRLGSFRDYIDNIVSTNVEFSNNSINTRDLSAAYITISNELYVNNYYANDLNISGELLSSVLRVPHEFTIVPLEVTLEPIIYNDWLPIGLSIYGQSSGDYSGFAVSLNSDGNIVAIGAPYSNSNRGRVNVYEYNSADDGWAPLGQTFDGNTDDNAGWSVSLNALGNILAIGALGNNSYRGQVRVYKYNNITGWIPIGQTIVGDAQSDACGYSISLNALGNIIAVSSPFNNGTSGNNSYIGRTRVYQYIDTGGSDSSWVQMAGHIDGSERSEEAGRCITLNSLGNIVAINGNSAINNNNSRGTVKVYKYIDRGGTDISWTPLGQTITGLLPYDNFGRSISLNAVGNIIAMGAINNYNYNGQVRVFEYTNDTSWVPIGQTIDAERSGDANGFSVSLNALGNILAIGARSNDGNDSTNSNRGHVRVYQYNNNANDPRWIPIGRDIDGLAPGNQFGYSVSLNASGTKLAVGGLYTYETEINSRGNVRIYQYQETSSLETNIINSFVVNGNLIVNGNKQTIKSSIVDISAYTITIANNLSNTNALATNPAGLDVSNVAGIYYDGLAWNISGGNLFIGNQLVALDVSFNNLQTTIYNSLIASKYIYTLSFGLLQTNITNSFETLYSISNIDLSFATKNAASANYNDLKYYIDNSFITKQTYKTKENIILQYYVSNAYVDGSFVLLNSKLDLSYALKNSVELSYNNLKTQFGTSFNNSAASNVDISSITIDTIATSNLALTSHVNINGDLLVAGDTSINSLNISNSYLFNNNNGYSSVYRPISDAAAIIEEYYSKFNTFGKVLYINADGSLYYLTGKGALSDIRLKEHIVDASPKLQDLLKVRIVDYNLKTNTHKKCIGVLAQELEPIFPGLVTEHVPNNIDISYGITEKYKSVKYSCFNVMVIKALQEQQEIINNLNLRLERLKQLEQLNNVIN